MGGLAETLHPSDLPEVLGAPGVSWATGLMGLLIFIAVGSAMTAVMQSSTAAIAVTLSAFYAGAVGMEQSAALIIGQNIGTATSATAPRQTAPSLHGRSSHRQPQPEAANANLSIEVAPSMPASCTSTDSESEISSDRNPLSIHNGRKPLN